MHLVFLDQCHAQAQFRVFGVGDGRLGAGLGGQLGQLIRGQVHDLAGTVALVKQALDQAQALDLNCRVQALAVAVALGLGEVVTALPDT